MNDGRPLKHTIDPSYLIRIGAFGRITQLSRKALRLYDQLGILSPAYIDPESGYRFYTDTQISKARFIRLMREADMPLATIRRVLEAESPAAAEQIIGDYKDEFEQHVLRVRQTAHRIMGYLHQENQTMSLEIEVKKVPPQQIISIKKRLKQPEMQAFIQSSIQALKELIAEQELQITNEVMGFYYGPINENSDGPLEVSFPVAGAAQPKGDIEVGSLPAHTAVSVVGGSDYYEFPTVLQVWDAAADWIRQNGYADSESNVTCYEVWHRDQIEVVWPFRDEPEKV
ncbi:MAG: MerR family transcriptional regulator [Chloroflexi bacterium]|nr:MerR family transcriptional regulator [Chloroflexota bacterium]